MILNLLTYKILSLSLADIPPVRCSWREFFILTHTRLNPSHEYLVAVKYLALAWNSRSPRRNTHVSLEKGEEEAKRNNKSTASEFQPYGSPLYIYISRTGDIFRTRPIYLFYSGAERGLEVALPRHGTPPKIKFSLRGASSRVKLCISLGISLPYLSLGRSLICGASSLL